MYSSNSINEVLKFTYPKLHHGKSWYVDFLSYDPATAKMRRKKYMLDSIPKITERRKRAAEMIDALIRQLRSGWSPWVNKTDNRGFILLSDALAKYAASVERVERAKTRKTYINSMPPSSVTSSITYILTANVAQEHATIIEVGYRLLPPSSWSVNTSPQIPWN